MMQQQIPQTISKYTEDNKLIRSGHHEFKKKSHLTSLIIYNEMAGLVDRGRAMVIVCLDYLAFTKAFSNVSHKICIEKADEAWTR